MKLFSFFIFALNLINIMPTYSNPSYKEAKTNKIHKHFKKVDKDGDGLLSKIEMINVHRDRIDRLFTKFDKNKDGKLSKKELREVRKEFKKRIYKSKEKKD